MLHKRIFSPGSKVGSCWSSTSQLSLMMSVTLRRPNAASLERVSPVLVVYSWQRLLEGSGMNGIASGVTSDAASAQQYTIVLAL